MEVSASRKQQLMRLVVEVAHGVLGRLMLMNREEVRRPIVTMLGRGISAGTARTGRRFRSEVRESGFEPLVSFVDGTREDPNTPDQGIHDLWLDTFQRGRQSRPRGRGLRGRPLDRVSAALEEGPCLHAQHLGDALERIEARLPGASLDA
jgi:hypothetical protein